MKKKFEYKESRGLPGGPNEMFTYVTGVFDIYQAPSNIEGQGMFAGKPFKKGDLIGLAHSNGQPASQLGRMHNHDENSPTMISKKSGNDRFVFAAKDLQPGDELTTNYRMQPELEQPEDFQYGGSVMGTDNLGNTKIMMPGNNYKFPGDIVFETPMAQRGKEVRVDYGDGSIKKLSTDSAEYRKLYNEGRIGIRNYDDSISMGSLPEVTVTADKKTGKNILEDYPYYNQLTEEEKKYFRDSGPIGRQIRSKATDGVGVTADGVKDFVKALTLGPLDDALEVASIPSALAAEGFAQLKGDQYDYSNALPSFGTFNNTQRAVSETAADEVKWISDKTGIPEWAVGFGVDFATDPAQWIPATAAVKAPVQTIKTGARIAKTAARRGMRTGLNRIGNAVDNIPSRINPKYYNPTSVSTGNPDVYYRKVGKDAYEDFVNSGVLRTQAEVTDNPIMGLIETKRELGQVRDAIKDYGQFTYRHPTSFRAPYFSRGRTADMTSGADDYLFQTRPGVVGDDAFSSGQMDILHGSGNARVPVGGYGIMDPMQRSAENFDVFKKSWWHGYKPIEVPKTTESFKSENVAKSADEVIAGSDDIVKATVRDVKPNAKRLDAVTQVNPLSQAQAKNLVEQGRNAELFKGFEEGANTIDDFVKSYTADLSSPEGFKRLVNQEADYLRSIGFDEARIATQAEINAGARLNEIINIGNTNRAIAQGERSAKNLVKNKNNFNNASYIPNKSGSDYFDDLFYKPGMEIDLFDLNKTKIGSKVLPGNTNLGTMFNNSRAVAAHEIGGHGLQSGRRLPVDSRLKKLEPLDEMTEGTKEAYRYFMQGSKGKEPSAYLHELRQAMLDNKLIRNRYQYISPEQLKRFQTLFDLRPSGTMNTMAGKYHSNTRILDFMKPTQSNFDLLARELNNLPAMVPIGIGLGGAAALSEYQEGGEETSWTDYINPMNWGVTNRDEAGNFKQAFRAARADGDDEFMWHGTRYNTELAPTPEKPKEEKPFYNPSILNGLSEEQTARRQALLNAANVVAAAQGDDENLRRLLVMSAAMENTLGADSDAYGRDYTRGPMSIDDIAYQDLFAIREGAKGYTTQQKKNAAWLNNLGLDADNMEQALRSDDPLAGMAAARLVYGRAPEALPSGDDPDALYNYYLKYYNKGGIDKYGGAEAHRKKFNDFYNQLYRQEGGEQNQFQIYKDYVYGAYDGTEMQKPAEKIYDKLNRVYYKEAKQSGTTVPNYILSKVMNQRG